jgi:hypothetical protein
LQRAAFFVNAALRLDHQNGDAKLGNVYRS